MIGDDLNQMTKRKTKTMTENDPFSLNIDLDARALKAAALGCIQKDKDQPYRPALHCVALDISPVAVVAVGLGGHKMIVAKAGEGLPALKPQTLLIPRKIIDKLKGKETFVSLAILGELNPYGTIMNPKGVFEYGESTIKFDFQDEVFPEWRRLCPTTATGEAADYATITLESVQKAYSLMSHKKKGNYVKILHNGTSPARIVFEGVDAFAVIMPLRLDIDLDTPLPAWV